MASLEERVANGIEWLTTHDPLGRFHLWYKAGILPGSPKPGQDEQSKADYAEYHRARRQWEVLYAAMEKEERSREMR